MKLRTGKFRRRSLLLALALTANVMQVLGGALPSRVVCLKADRPPQVEFFSGSCSCRQDEHHSCADRSQPCVPCLGERCTDIHLKSHGLFATRPFRLGASLRGQRYTPRPERLLSPSSFINLQAGLVLRVLIRSGPPPSLGPLFAESILRC